MPSSHAISDRDEAIAFQGALVVIDVNGGLLHQLNAALIVSDFSRVQEDKSLIKAHSRRINDSYTICLRHVRALAHARRSPHRLSCAMATPFRRFFSPLLWRSAPMRVNRPSDPAFCPQKTMTGILYKGLTTSI